MTKKEFTEQARKAAGLQYDLYQKFPGYVVMDFALSTYSNGKQDVKYNIYTHETSHNAFTDFQDFVRFMELLIKDGLVDVKIKMLKAELERNQEVRINAIDAIADLKKELEKLSG